MNRNLYRPFKHFALLGVSAFLLLGGLVSGRSQITVTSNPLDGATSVSPSAPVVFTFSAAMNTTASTALFSSDAASFYVVTYAWSAGNTVLTCTPVSPFTPNTNISWQVFGFDPTFQQVSASGSFTTGAGSSTGGGSGTNKITTFSAGKVYFYEQLSAGAPVPDTNAAYGFTATTSLSSNRTASAVTVALPGAGGSRDLNQSFFAHETYTFFDYGTNKNALEATYPQGDYVFNVTGTPANLQGTVTLPTTMLQPNAPHISNFAAAQTVNAAQAFTLIWDAFQGGTASDFISVTVGDNVFQSPNFGTNGALNGTATFVLIPAGKLGANSNYTADITFYRFAATTNATYATVAYRATSTQFEINTIGAASTVPVVSKPIWIGGSLGFDVATSPNQALKVRYSTDCSLPIALWQTIATTNSPGVTVHITIPPQAGATGFFRIQNGP